MDFEYIGSGTLTFSSQTTVVLEKRSVTRKVLFISQTFHELTPESVYSYYSSRFKNIVFESHILEHKIHSILSKSNNSLTSQGGY